MFLIGQAQIPLGVQCFNSKKAPETLYALAIDHQAMVVVEPILDPSGAIEWQYQIALIFQPHQL